MHVALFGVGIMSACVSYIITWKATNTFKTWYPCTYFGDVVPCVPQSLPFTNVDNFSVVTHCCQAYGESNYWSMDIDPPSVCPAGGAATVEHHPRLLETVPLSRGEPRACLLSQRGLSSDLPCCSLHLSSHSRTETWSVTIRKIISWNEGGVE